MKVELDCPNKKVAINYAFSDRMIGDREVTTCTGLLHVETKTKTAKGKPITKPVTHTFTGTAIRNPKDFPSINTGRLLSFRRMIANFLSATDAPEHTRKAIMEQARQQRYINENRDVKGIFEVDPKAPGGILKAVTDRKVETPAADKTRGATSDHNLDAIKWGMHDFSVMRNHLIGLQGSLMGSLRLPTMPPPNPSTPPTPPRMTSFMGIPIHTNPAIPEGTAFLINPNDLEKLRKMLTLPPDFYARMNERIKSDLMKQIHEDLESLLLTGLNPTYEQPTPQAPKPNGNGTNGNGNNGHKETK